jgi:glycosyltransferase involved in cell wall biosynthesis
VKKILLIIPAFNESESIVGLIKKVDAFRAKWSNQERELDYIVINDGSVDNSEKILLANGIKHIELIQNLGIGGAVQTGYKYALENDYDIACQFDGDGQHEIESLPALVDPILADEVDFAVGSRFVEGSPSEFTSSAPRQIGIGILSKILKFVSKLTIKDITSGYRAGNRKVIETFARDYPRRYPEPESYIALTEQNLRVKEFGVKMYERKFGKSSINFRAGFTYMYSVVLTLLIVGLVERKNQ